MSTANYRLKLLRLLPLLLLCSTGFADADPLGSIDTGKAIDSLIGKDGDHSADFREQRARAHQLKARAERKDDQNESTESNNSPDLNNDHGCNKSSNQNGRNDSFDGSEFNASTFADSDFSRHSFRDLFDSSRPGDGSDSTVRRANRTRTGPEHDGRLALERGEKAAAEADKMVYRDLIKALYFLPGDWVPSSLDSLWNGGFTTPPDSGLPVPYRLNGHVDIQRKLPWEKGD